MGLTNIPLFSALSEKMKLLDLIETLGPERARAMAAKLKMNLARAA